MATEELQGGDLQNPAQPAPAAPAQAPVPLPPYPEMILAAIEALNEENGSNKSSISRHIGKHIESTYGQIPPAHSALLNHHLNKMKSSGQLQFLKNNYLIPDPNSPPRRGRGRPPKPKEPQPEGAVQLPPRPRGRPPKSLDPTAPAPAATPAPAVTGRKRGRPPKAAAAEGAAPTEAAAQPRPPASAGAVPHRGRGRPPKVKPVVTASLAA